MTDMDFMEVCELDNIADEAEVHYDYHAIIKYCRERGIEPLDMIDYLIKSDCPVSAGQSLFIFSDLPYF